MISEPNVRWLGRIAFGDALELQEHAVAARRANDDIVDEILLLEHEPVYTIGRTPDRSSLPSENSLPHPLFAINRGGQATYHGPGQLVGYPILNLKHYGQDLHRYLRWIEDVLIGLVATYGIEAGTREGLTGVWVEQRKIASIGVGVRHWITMHGFALNVCGDLQPFSSIVPCGISGVEMTSIEREIGRPISVIDVAKDFEKIAGESLETLAARSEASVAPNA
jgi:lipoyl(octanoyl) transferase